MTTRESLELALATDPDNRALHSAYADLLIEEGDPRGEYIRQELADPGVAFVEDRTERTRREMEWLGPLERFQVNYPTIPRVSDDLDPVEFQANTIAIHWSLGWIDLAIVARDYPAVVAAIGGHPLSRLLRELYLYNPADRESLTGRQFSTILNDLGARPIRDWTMYGFESLGDELIERMEASAGLQRLRSLNLTRCGITDDGARMLANSRFVRTLESLRLGHNHLSAIGVAELAAVGFPVEERQTEPGWENDRH